MRQVYGMAAVLTVAALAITVAGCGKGKPPAPKAEVVVYTALDQLYSEPILRKFEAATGIATLAVYDSEAAKTVGLVNRLIAERERPICDVFWNNEVVRTIQLKDAGVIEPFVPSNAADIPPSFKDPEGYWTGFAARARVLAFNAEKVSRPELPTDISHLTYEEWKGKVGMAYPLFGSTATHAAVLWSEWGPLRAKRFFEDLRNNGVVIFDGNMSAARAVASGEILMCMTDTDDAHLLKGEGKPIDWKLIDHDGRGGLLIPNTVALVKNAPHPEAGKRLIEYLLSAEVEAALAACPSAQIPLRPGVEAPVEVKRMAEATFLDVNFTSAALELEASAAQLKGLYGSR